MKLYLIYNNNLDHYKVLEKGYGASEFQFYILAKKLSVYFDITIFNQSGINKLDNIQYRPYSDLMNNINIDTNAKIIVMRDFKIIENIITFYPSNNIIIWSHDHMCNDNHLINTNSLKIINEHNIKVVSVSNFHKNNLNNYVNNITTIYNNLYSDIYIKQHNIINKDNIIFASAWAKGLGTIISLFDRLHQNHPHFKLLLLRPNYNTCSPPVRSYIQLLDTIDDKKEYCSIIQSSLCTLTTEFPETFGCVFAESYYLNTPVIATNNINGLHEFINNDHICNLHDYDSFERLVLQFYTNRPFVELSSQFIDNLQPWIDFLNYQ